MKLTREQVVEIAELARLVLTEDEIVLYQEQLSSVLAYAERLQALDTDAIPPTATVLPPRNVMRTDGPRPSMARDDILANAPDAEDGCFRVQAVFE
jgi:aspartyl-tRNA(Asn)/glutamyl-tRNA(Gln) amidotransferase subunit C